MTAASAAGVATIGTDVKWSPLAFHFDENNIYLGMKAEASATASMVGIDLIGWDSSNFYDYITKTNIENNSEAHIVGLSFGFYMIVGASVDFGWNIDYIANRFNEIWF